MDKRIYVPTSGLDDWRRLLADPNKQWKPGYSARALAECWEAANGWPPEVAGVLRSSTEPALTDIEFLIAIPELKVNLPPRGRASQNDLFVLGKAADGRLVAITVEGKVDEPFGPTLGDWSATTSAGKAERLLFLTRELGLLAALPPTIRYQLLHRTTSALLLARRFNASHAVLAVHSFSPTGAWYEDFRAFVQLFGVQDAGRDILYKLRDRESIRLYAGWVSGDVGFLGA